MSISHDSALTEYQRSRTALMDVVNDLEATDDQAREAEAAALKLNHDFIQKSIATIAERSAQYQEFVTYMQSVLASLKRGGPLHVLNTVDQAVSAAVAVGEQAAG